MHAIIHNDPIPYLPDLYSFDVSEEKAVETYAEICSAYEKLFSKLELPVVKGEMVVGTRVSSSNLGPDLVYYYGR